MLIAAVTTGVLLTQPGSHSQVVSACTVGASTSGSASGSSSGSSGPSSAPTYQLAPDQAQNAAIIAGVALKLGLPDHAVTVALATALQESGLRDLTYGDRDSVGLFQQRPSQGWGTTNQILDPVYATTAFYGRLVKVPGWASLAVTEAAQAVQQSGDPAAYAQWESEARDLAIALTGEAPAAFACRLAAFSGPAPAPTALTSAADNEMGPGRLDTPLAVKPGWAVASWVVAHAWRYHVASVSFEGSIWTARSGRWERTSTDATPTAVAYVLSGVQSP